MSQNETTAAVETPVKAPRITAPVKARKPKAGKPQNPKKLPNGKVMISGRTASYHREDGSLPKPLVRVLAVLARQSKPIKFERLASLVGAKDPKTVRWFIGSHRDDRDPSSLIGRGFVKQNSFKLDGKGNNEVTSYDYEITKSGEAALKRAEK